MNPETDVALFDMDGTMCDYEGDLRSSLDKLRAPNEPIVDYLHDQEPEYIRARMKLIKSSVEWWANMSRFELGFDIWKMVTSLGMRKMILTQGPMTNPNAWAGKKIWIERNLGIDVDVTITRDKGLVYGKLLVDDWPEYAERWLKWRPRGLVVMPAARHNQDFKHPQVVRYDGDNYKEVLMRIQERMSNFDIKAD